MEHIIYIIASNIATFALGWIVSRMVTRHQIVEEQAELEAKRQNTAMWIEFIKSQGGKNE